jgi:hypothetical protein
VTTETLRLRSDLLEWREVEGEIVALDLRTSRYLAVNRSGARLWSILATGATREQLVARLVEIYGVLPDRAEAETASFLEVLSAEDLIEVA